MSAWTQARINLLKRLWPEGRSGEMVGHPVLAAADFPEKIRALGALAFEPEIQLALIEHGPAFGAFDPEMLDEADDVA